MPRNDRLKFYDKVAQSILLSYEQVRGLALDTDLIGESGESVLHRWMREWLPSRVAPKSGAIISREAGPTNQMDCVLFDHALSPVYYRINTVEVLPIEGVLGAIEVNTGLNTNYGKLQKDSEKLDAVATLLPHRLARLPSVLSHTPFSRGIEGLTAAELKQDLQYHHEHAGKPLLLLYAEDIAGDLREAASRLAKHNLNVGLRRSVDGLFVVRKGFALHRNPNMRGWLTQRMAKADFAFLEMAPWRSLGEVPKSDTQVPLTDPPKPSRWL